MDIAIKANNVSVSYGKLRVVDSVSFDIPKGSIATIIGPNGSGKTTLLKALVGFIPYRGSISVMGQNPLKSRGKIGYVPQRFDFDRTLPMTVLEFLKLSSPECFSGKCVHHSLYNNLGIDKILEEKLGSLSGGQLQRVLIARALLDNPGVLFLDEPASGIDVQGQRSVQDVLKQVNRLNETTIVMISHEIDIVANFSNFVICLNHKLVCSGNPKQALSQESLQELYGESAAFFKHKHK